MGHHHDHNHSLQGEQHGKAFAFGIALNALFIIIELFYGLKSNSSSLLADAGHNVSDVMGLILAWIGIWLAHKKPKGRFSYGYKKSTILISILNAMLLFVAIGFITKDAIGKFVHPEPVVGAQVMIVAAIGIVINGLTALLFAKGQKSDLNIRGAFLHMAADAAVSLGVVIAGLLIKITGLTWIDPIMALIVVGVIIVGTWQLFIDSVSLALDAIPKNINMGELKESVLNHNEVKNIHDLHIWAMSTSENALSMHLVVNNPENSNSILADIYNLLSADFNIRHLTIQIESVDKDFHCVRC